MSQVSSFLIARDTIRAFRRERHFVVPWHVLVCVWWEDMHTYIHMNPKKCESHFEKCHFQLTFGFIIPFHVWFSWCLAGVLSPDDWFYRFKLKVAWSFQLFICCVFGICNLCHKSIYPMEGWLKDVVGKEPRIQEYPKTFVIVNEGDTADGSEIRLTSWGC